MNSSHITTEDVKAAAELYLKDDAFFVYLLGSAGTERFHDESDIDLAAYFKTNPDYQKLSDLSLKFSDHFGRECDLVSLNKIDPIYARQVLETGRELAVYDRTFLNLWKANQLSMYPDFKASRKVIEDNLMNRKKYG